PVAPAAGVVRSAAEPARPAPPSVRPAEAAGWARALPAAPAPRAAPAPPSPPARPASPIPLAEAAGSVRRLWAAWAGLVRSGRLPPSADHSTPAGPLAPIRKQALPAVPLTACYAPKSALESGPAYDLLRGSKKRAAVAILL